MDNPNQKILKEIRFSRYSKPYSARFRKKIEKEMQLALRAEVKAAKAEAVGNAAKATVAREAAAARKIWLAEAQKGLADFSQ